MQHRNASRPGWSRWWLIPVLALLAGLPTGGRADDWPQWLGPQRAGIWREKGILDTFPAKGPTVRWRTEIGGGYAGPAVADGRVYVTDRILATGVKDSPDPFKLKETPGKER